MSNEKNFKIWFLSNIYLVLTAAIQLAGFIILGRALGALEYGKILAVTVFASLGVEFVGLGCGDSLIKKVAVNRQLYPAVIGECIKISLYTLPIVSVIVIALLYFYTDTDLSLIAILVVTELYSIRFLALIDHSAIALKDMTHLNRIKLIYAILRLLVILAAAFILQATTAWLWVPFQILCSVIITSFLFYISVKRFGGIKQDSQNHISLRESVLFSFTQTTRAIQSNVDKYAVQFIFSPLIFALYAVAGRFMQYSLIPLQAVLRMSYPRFFEAEKNKQYSSVTLAFKVLPVIFAVSLIPFAFLLWGGVIVELLLGESYIGVAQYMALLAPLPISLGFQYIFMDLLTALDAHRTRVYISGCHVLTLGGYFWWFSYLAVETMIHGFILVNIMFVLLYCVVAIYKARYFLCSKAASNDF